MRGQEEVLKQAFNSWFQFPFVAFWQFNYSKNEIFVLSHSLISQFIYQSFDSWGNLHGFGLRLTEIFFNTRQNVNLFNIYHSINFIFCLCIHSLLHRHAQKRHLSLLQHMSQNLPIFLLYSTWWYQDEKKNRRKWNPVHGKHGAFAKETESTEGAEGGTKLAWKECKKCTYVWKIFLTVEISEICRPWCSWRYSCNGTSKVNTVKKGL